MRRSTIYDGMTFPGYAFQEYPKIVKDSEGRRVTVANKAEEDAAIGKVEAKMEPKADTKVEPKADTKVSPLIPPKS